MPIGGVVDSKVRQKVTSEGSLWGQSGLLWGQNAKGFAVGS